MDYCGIPRGSMYGEALKRLARLTLAKTPPDGSLADAVPPLFSKMLKDTRTTTDMSSTPIAHNELDTLFALCSCAASVQSQVQADILVSRFTNYLSESSNQRFSSKETVRNIYPTAWTQLTYELTKALSVLGLNKKFKEQTRTDVVASLQSYVNNLRAETITLHGAFSLVGFLQGVSEEISIVTHDILRKLLALLNEDFYNKVESLISEAATTPDGLGQIAGFLQTSGFEFSSLYLIKLLGELCSHFLRNLVHADPKETLMDHLLVSDSVAYNIQDRDQSFVEELVNGYAKNNEYISAAPAKITNSTPSRRELSAWVKADALDITSFGYVASVVSFSYFRAHVGNYLDNLSRYDEADGLTTGDKLNSPLLRSVFAASAILSESDRTIGLLLDKHLPTILSYPNVTEETTRQLTKSLTYSLKTLSEDDTVSTIYSLTNLLSDPGDSDSDKINEETQSLEEEADNPRFTTLEAQKSVCRNVITAVSIITRAANDESINTLVITLLSQKLRKNPDEFNCVLLKGLIGFVDIMQKREFSILMRHFYDANSGAVSDSEVVRQTSRVWIELSNRMLQKSDSELYSDYIKSLLSAIIAKGDIDYSDHHRTANDVATSASEIQIYLGPLAHALPDINKDSLTFTDKTIIGLFRDAWFNLCVHGFAYNSPLYTKNYNSLRRIAYSTPPLAAEESWNRSETSIEMNPVLRRGTSKQNEKLYKDTIKDIVTPKTVDIRVVESQISRPGLIFLSAMLLLEMLRVDCGNCSMSLEYLSDPSVTIAKLDIFVGAIAYYCCSKYIERVRTGGSTQFIVNKVSTQLENILIYCCHRDKALQDTAYQCADRMIRLMPSTLCHERSAFSMLDILTLLYDSIVDSDTHEYDPSVSFTSDVMKITLSLSDSYVWRKQTLQKFTSKAREWTTAVLLKCEQDMKSIMHTYVSKADNSHRTINYGVTFASEMASKVLPVDREYYQLDIVSKSGLGTTSGFVSQYPWRGNVETDTRMRILQYKMDNEGSLTDHCRYQITNLLEKNATSRVTHDEFVDVFEEIAGVILLSPTAPGDLVRWCTELPFVFFTADNIELASDIWLGIMKEKPDLSSFILAQILKKFEDTVNLGMGLYSRRYDLKDAKFYPMEYLPSSKKIMDQESSWAERNIQPHLTLIRLLSSHFEASKYQSDHILKLFTRFMTTALSGLTNASLHPLSRLARFELISFAVAMLQTHISLHSRDISRLITLILDGSLSWFSHRSRPPFGSNRLKIKAEWTILQNIASYFSSVTFHLKDQEKKRCILLMFLDDEISFLCSWLFPQENRDSIGTYNKYRFDEKTMNDAFMIDGRLAIGLFKRYSGSSELKSALSALVAKYPFKVLDDPAAISLVTTGSNLLRSPAIVVWNNTSPLDSITHFMAPYNTDPLVLQYAMRSIESFDPHQTFFYVPQIVQTLRYDKLGYIRRYILETANVSQLFAHQIIWNMSANSYRDEDCQEPDPIKPRLDEIKNTMVKGFSAEAKEYYEREFSFFNDVTSISGKLKPYIKKSKAEKKEKIDEEMGKIPLEEGVYLPSNPDGIIVGIDRKSGRPLQSHAKAPFMATFKVKRKVEGGETEDSDSVPTEPETEVADVSAIFKVGDDCRQDVLVLQVMALFRTIWMTDGLDVYLYPYRVTATGPGCGIIDVLPHSTSRDMLGREQVNSLYEYFLTQFGPETSAGFQKARNNFVKSLASSSIFTYLLSLKDRHNGNIMYDDQGHVLHIDFGYCFDIAPGGVAFEQSPFKLTKEMVQVLGGSPNTQAFRWYVDLCVKGFLTIRPYADAIIDAVEPMLESGLPCFKGQTIKRLRARFVPEKSNREAAAYMRNLIKKSYENMATKGYDEFQKMTNGIPY